ncbi:MAG: hypothetical protein A3G32_05065 [Deltaproteobacteria bacterium RIFCSPLOWO2_12_FULL_40_28]|nr:MAG: hypothetical protein A3C45_09175 [Deltaproteobacteria bacterium RIFCSPHIGHO2_02_FULL_40_28]OGQ19733.1 MAG: hypothetical protein A3E27_08370 [Deltaproteobacteria bacterium RIFCSPHIGHO2_12_FULL_40_32]OGQ41010.1 MAG: hypothetical protein A3I69_03785 [Deltaproteobacteria bacterium RIFCSPLOWO2_02_FULL_40_36]OGQ54126.1 MAG: hypothetical protein A3G32_05065 [Deltaproteobacteria bacterium RIFCSPLOWO2_12_FULL_40_28]
MKRLLFWVGIILLLGGVNQASLLWINPYVIQVLGLAAIHIILAASLNLVMGFTGQFSLGHAGFMAIGAYTSAAITVYGAPLFPSGFLFDQILFVIALFVGGIVSAFFGYLIGLPSLRLKGDYLAIVTLGFGEVIRVIILNMDFVGGARGFSGIPERTNLFWILLFMVFTLRFLWKSIYSVKGLSFRAVRDDEIAAESLGVSSTKVKVTAFVWGAFFAGLGGGLFAHLITYLNPSSFTFLKSVEIVAMVVLGGLGSFSGSVLAAVLLSVLPEFLRIVSDFRMVIYSLLIILIMIIKPMGLMGYKEISFKFRKK